MVTRLLALADAPVPPTPPTRSRSRSATAGALRCWTRMAAGQGPVGRAGPRPPRPPRRGGEHRRGEVLRDDQLGAGRGHRDRARPRRRRGRRRRAGRAGHPDTLARLRRGQQARLATALVVREDSLTLFGFADDEERDVFGLLQTVSGHRAAAGARDAGRARPGRAGAALWPRATSRRSPGCRASAARARERMVLELRDKVVAPAPAPELVPAAAGGPRRDQVVEALLGPRVPARSPPSRPSTPCSPRTVPPTPAAAAARRAHRAGPRPMTGARLGASLHAPRVAGGAAQRATGVMRARGVDRACGAARRAVARCSGASVPRVARAERAGRAERARWGAAGGAARPPGGAVGEP